MGAVNKVPEPFIMFPYIVSRHVLFFSNTVGRQSDAGHLVEVEFGLSSANPAPAAADPTEDVLERVAHLKVGALKNGRIVLKRSTATYELLICALLRLFSCVNLGDNLFVGDSKILVYH